jgi:hypothetical protein
MSRFPYLRDPLFLLGCLAYALNRWLLKPYVHGRFLHSYFNDCWLIPCALPPILWLHRKLGLRQHDRAPGPGEILSHLLFWSLLFEWIGPQFVSHAVGDPFDVIAYAAGAMLAALWWHRDLWVKRIVSL